ncbi:MAG: hypothetical protein IKD69_04960 [Solobacterium sp.]|nr:hypothetical protein [Solobacterium sp.]
MHQQTVCRASFVLSALIFIAYDGAYICFSGLFILPKIADSGSKKILAYISSLSAMAKIPGAGTDWLQDDEEQNGSTKGTYADPEGNCRIICLLLS